MDDAHIYDSVFKTTAHKLPGLMVPLVNEAFGSKHASNTPVERMPESFLARFGLREADAVFSIGGSVYHVECQSTTDASMPIRMLEYDSAIAFGLSRTGGAEAGVVRVPRSCVVYLRGVPASARSPLTLEFPDNQHVSYMPRAIDARAYAPADVAARELYALAPFAPMRYEAGQGQANEAAALLAEAAELEKAMHGALSEYEYNTLCYLYTEVARHVLRRDLELAEEVESIMNGRILELPDEKIARLERERDAAARERDAAAAREQAAVRERDNDRRAFVDLLHKAGVSDEEIAKALAV